MLEANEDRIAAIVENLQLGRLDQCFALFTALNSNLLKIASDVDSFPGDSDLYSGEAMAQFPDGIMRKDISESLRPHGEWGASGQDPAAFAPQSLPLPPPCQKCFAQHVSHVFLAIKYEL